MNKLLLGLYLLAILNTIPMSGQVMTLQGTVREINSKRRPVSNVQILANGANPTVSDASGSFRLTFIDKKPGDRVFLQVEKYGYELVNKHEVEEIKISADGQLIDIILARAGVLDSVKAIYYGVSNKSLQTSFERNKIILRQKRDSARLRDEQYAEQLEQLNKDYDNQRKNLDELTEKFASVNFDDVALNYQQALELYKSGNINQAIETLESNDLAQRTERIIAEQKRLSQLQGDNSRLKVEKKQIIENLRLMADIYSTKSEISKAEILYDRLLSLDSSDVEILQDAAHFYQRNNNYDKAIRTYLLIINNPRSDTAQVADSYSRVGDVYTFTGNLFASIDAYSKATERFLYLYNIEPTRSSRKNNLAISYSKLGSTQSSLGNLDKALAFFEEYNRLEKELYEAYPQNLDFKNNLAISYSNLGSTHTALGNLPKALTFFEDETKLFEELHESYPQNVDFKNGLAISYGKLGSTQTAMGNLSKALAFFEKQTKLFEELYESYPQDIDFKNGLAISYSNLGEVHTDLGDLGKALIFFEKRSKLGKELYEAYSQNVEFKNGLAISYSKLGYTYNALGDLPKALTYFEEQTKLFVELYESYPQNVSFKNGLAISYQYLGSAHSALGNSPKALAFFEEYNRLEKELYESYPQNVSFKNGLAISYQYLGSAHSALGNSPKSLAFFEEYNRLEKELYESYPQNVSFKNGLAISYQYLGSAHSALGNLSKALTYFEEYNRLQKELYESFQYSPSFKYDLATSYYKIGIVSSALNNLPRSSRYFEEATKLFGELFNDYPKNLSFRKSLATAYSNLGDTYVAIGDSIKASNFYKKRDLLNDEQKNVNHSNPFEIREKIKEEQKRFVQVETELKDRRSDLEKEVIQQITNLKSQIPFYYANFDYAKVENIYEQMIRLDSNNIGAIDDYSIYLMNQNKIPEAIDLAEKVVQNIKIGDNKEQYNRLGTLYASVGKYDKAISNFDLALKSIRGNVFDSIEISSRTKNIKGIQDKIIILNNLGNLYSEQKNHAKALSFFNESLELLAKLEEIDSLPSVMKSLWADTYIGIGNILINFVPKKPEAYIKSYEHLANALQIYEELTISDTLNSENLYMKAVCLNNLALLNEKVDSFNKSEKYYTESFLALQTLHKKFHLNKYSIESVKTLLAIALMYNNFQGVESENSSANQKAVFYFTKANEILDETHKKNNGDDELSISLRKIINRYLLN